MEKKIKIFLGLAVVAGIAYLTRDKWMPIFKSEDKKEAEVKSGFISAQDKLGTFTKVETKSNMVDGGSGTTKGGWTKTKDKIKGLTNI